MRTRQAASPLAKPQVDRTRWPSRQSPYLPESSTTSVYGLAGISRSNAITLPCPIRLRTGMVTVSAAVPLIVNTYGTSAPPALSSRRSPSDSAACAKSRGIQHRAVCAGTARRDAPFVSEMRRHIAVTRGQQHKTKRACDPAHGRNAERTAASSAPALQPRPAATQAGSPRTAGSPFMHLLYRSRAHFLYLSTLKWLIVLRPDACLPMHCAAYRRRRT